MDDVKRVGMLYGQLIADEKITHDSNVTPQSVVEKVAQL